MNTTINAKTLANTAESTRVNTICAVTGDNTRAATKATNQVIKEAISATTPRTMDTTTLSPKTTKTNKSNTAIFSILHNQSIKSMQLEFGCGFFGIGWIAIWPHSDTCHIAHSCH